ncbi:hypothetical protein TrLO_g9827 [Triparma laevis f. longispina]|uniref:3-oxo-5-alpha-steroid 4-dehydrogenase C-terminal domain-containing protein n=1 Tax=Triparma laevis f. longispina TaxID=1714387 RepID=A0A9W7FRM3_9STRA|nr:hypothetical protein TrLO_g9827 [Triparma laevis f. longispina]
MPLTSSLTISIAYTGFSWMTIYYSSKISPSSMPLSNGIDDVLSTMFLAWGSFYLRWDSAGIYTIITAFVVFVNQVPSGGLFHLIAAPHYLFEFISWLGVALCTQHVYSLVLFFGMCAYLIERAKAQDEWNSEKLKEKYPSPRKRIIPFVW